MINHQTNLNLKNDSLTEIINDMDRFYNTKTVVTFLKDKPNIYEQNYCIKCI